MNLEESDSFREEIEKNTRRRRSVMLSIVLCAFLIVLLASMIGVISYKDSITEKFYYDDKLIPLSGTFYKNIGDTTYLSIEELSTLFGYEYRRGNYGLYDEDEKSCYLTGPAEIVAISADTDRYKKYIEMTTPITIGTVSITQKTNPGYCETFKVDKPVTVIDGKLYVPLENVPDMFNVQIDWQQYRKKIYSMTYVISSILPKLPSLGITETTGYYENMKAMLYGYVVRSENNNSIYGVYSLNENKDILTLQYNDITFLQNTKEFFITSENNKAGLADCNGSTLIKANEYDELSLLDFDKKLYLAKISKDYGVLNRMGKRIVELEYDAIGYDTKEFTIEPINNEMLLFDSCIPVKKNGKYGLIKPDDKSNSAEVVLSVLYDGFGYKSSSSTGTAGNEESVLIIPSSVGINGIVINQGDMFGIFDVNEGKIVLPCTFSKIYAIRKSGKLTYYAEYNGTTYELRDFLEDNGLVNINKDGEYVPPKEVEENETTKSNDSNSSSTEKDNNDSDNRSNNDSSVSNDNDNTNNNDSDSNENESKENEGDNDNSSSNDNSNEIVVEINE